MFTLHLVEDRLAPGVEHTLPALNRILYVRSGTVMVNGGGGPRIVTPAATWHGASRCTVSAGLTDASVLRFELNRTGSAAIATGPATTELLTHALELKGEHAWLMRCDRVEFAPGGEALPHGHKGPGIRYLLAGELEVRVGGRPGRVMKPGDAWFESGGEPVHAIASRREPTAFLRVSILPRSIRGQSSIVYVDPAHATVKPRTYTVYVDEPIDIGSESSAP